MKAIRICFYGPESTGKSTMARRMAERYHTAYVPEVAREMITSSQFTEADIIRIGEAQVRRILEKASVANKVLFCDTDLITTQIYSQVYLKVVPPILLEFEKQAPMDHYFLFSIDVPWVADGLRDLGDKREEMLEVFRTRLVARGITYTMISGPFAEREKQLIQCIDEILAAR